MEQIPVRQEAEEVEEGHLIQVGEEEGEVEVDLNPVEVEEVEVGEEHLISVEVEEGAEVEGRCLEAKGEEVEGEEEVEHQLALQVHA